MVERLRGVSVPAMNAALGSYRGFRLTAVRELDGCSGVATRAPESERHAAVILTAKADTLPELVGRLRGQVERWSREQIDAPFAVPTVKE